MWVRHERVKSLVEPQTFEILSISRISPDGFAGASQKIGCRVNEVGQGVAKVTSPVFCSKFLIGCTLRAPFSCFVGEISRIKGRW